MIEKSNVQNETFATEVTETETKLEKSNVSDTSSIGMGKITPHHPWLEMCWRKELQISKEEKRFEILAPHFESLKQLVDADIIYAWSLTWLSTADWRLP